MRGRLGLIGGSDAKRASGMYSHADRVALQDAKRYLARFGYDSVFNALTSSGTEEAFDVSRDGRWVYVVVRGTRTTASIFQYECSTPWDLATISYTSKSLVIGDWEINPSGITISDDGTRLFFGGYQNDTIWSATLATPFDLATATVDVKRAYVGTQATTPNTPVFGDSGTKLYVMSAANDIVYQYTLSTAWDVSTASYANKSLTVTSIDATPQAVFFKPDGTKLYIVGGTGVIVASYTLATAWDVSTATADYANKSFLLTGQLTVTNDVAFKTDGTKMYVLSGGTAATDRVYEYSLATAWDVTSASSVSNFSVNAQEATCQGLAFSDDGTKMYVVGTTNDTVYQYTLSTAWDLSTASYASKSFSVTTQETNPTALCFSADGTRMYVTGTTGDDVNQYSLSTAWDVSTASFLRVSAAVGDTTPNGIAIKDDGTKLYVVGSGSGAVREFSLSTAYDVSTMSLTRIYPVSFVDATLTGLAFKSDGTKMFIAGDAGDRIFEFSLGQAWNVNSVPGRWYAGNEELTPADVFFKPDGTKLYLIGATGDDVNEYDLSTAWDLGTISFVRVSATVGEATPAALYFSDDGTRMYVIGSTNDAVRQFTLSTAWNVATLSFDKSLSVGFETVPSGLAFKSDGAQLYVLGETNDCVYQIPLGTSWDIGTAQGYVYVTGNETVPRALHITSNGALLYLVGNGSDNIRKYALSTPYQLGTASLSQSLAISEPYGLHVNGDGTRIYVTVDSASTVAPSGTGRMVRVLHLTTPHDLTTASLDTKEWIPLYGLTGAAVTPWAVHLSPDENRMWVLGDVVAGMYQFTLRFA